MPRPRRGEARRIAIALLLTIGPIAAIGYFGLKTIAERERTLGLTYAATDTLVRDRLVLGIEALEASARARESPPDGSRRLAISVMETSQTTWVMQGLAAAAAKK